MKFENKLTEVADNNGNTMNAIEAYLNDPTIDQEEGWNFLTSYVVQTHPDLSTIGIAKKFLRCWEYTHNKLENLQLTPTYSRDFAWEKFSEIVNIKAAEFKRIRSLKTT